MFSRLQAGWQKAIRANSLSRSLDFHIRGIMEGERCGEVRDAE